MAKFGSDSIDVLMAGGYSLLPLKAKGLTLTHKAMQANTTGLGDAWPDKTPTGMQDATITIGEGFYDNDTDSMHTALRGSQATSRVLSVALEGDIIGQPFIGHAGTYGMTYEVAAKRDDLTKATVTHSVSGAREEGVILQSTATKVADWNTEGADSVDHGASTANGGSGYFHITAYAGFTNIIGKIRHSADDVTYADLLTFSTATAIGGERVTVSGTVNRHLAFDGNVTGSGSVTVFAGFARNT